MKKIPNIWHRALLTADVSIQEVVKNLNEIEIKIVLIVDKNGVLIGTISDGDVRRGLLKGLTLQSPITNIIHKDALVVPPELDRQTVIQLMMANKIQQIPIVDENFIVIGMHLWDEVNEIASRSNSMVIMAGGKGTRLMPHTKYLPKGMVEVSGKPILEHIINKAKLEGFHKFYISIFHLGDIIEDYFGNGKKFGVNIDYLKEDSPLGTIGALSLLKMKKNESFIVTNGDVLTDIRYSQILDYHQKQNADATMAVRTHEIQNPYGVVELDGLEIKGFEEKPIAESLINAGVYAFSPKILKKLDKNLACNVNTLFDRARKDGLKTVAYLMHESWLDVGKPADLIRANKI